MSSNEKRKIANEQNEWEKIDHAVVESGQFVNNNLNKILIAIGVVVLIACAYFAYKQFVVAPQELEAQAAIYKGQRYFETGNDSIAIYGDANGYIGFEAIINEYSSTDVASLAKLYAGIGYARMGQYEKGMEYVKAFKGNDAILKHLAQGTIGDCLVNLGKAEEAIPYFIKAAEGVDNMVQSAIMYKKAGLVYRELKQYDKVIEIFTKVKNNYMNSPLAQDADKYIEEAKMLQGK